MLLKWSFSKRSFDVQKQKCIYKISQSARTADLCSQKQQSFTGVHKLWTTPFAHEGSEYMFTSEFCILFLQWSRNSCHYALFPEQNQNMRGLEETVTKDAKWKCLLSFSRLDVYLMKGNQGDKKARPFENWTIHFERWGEQSALTFILGSILVFRIHWVL